MAETARLDALKEKAVNKFVDDVVNHAGRVDISMNVITYGDVQKPLLEISLDDFVRPITIQERAQFLPRVQRQRI